MNSSRTWNMGDLLLILVGICGLIGPKLASSATTQLKFNKKGEFKIMQVSDLHYANGKDTPCSDVLPSEVEGCSDLNTTYYLRRFIQTENPDLILFTGDQIHTIDSKDIRKSMDEIFAPAIETNIPWAAILGNHDTNHLLTGLEGEEVMQYIVGLKNTLSRMRPANLAEDEPIKGWGNYNLEIAGAEGSTFQDKSVLNLYLLDSGDYIVGKDFYTGYDWIHPSQQAWFTRTSKQLQEEYMSEPEAQKEPAPGLVFFHIPIPEYNNITASEMIGVKQEKVICPGKNSGFFDTILKAGDIKGIFVGHGHVNDYCGELCDIQLCYDAGFGYHGYGKAGWPRRARIINMKLAKTTEGSWGPVKSIETWKRLHDDQLTLIDPQILWTASGEVSGSVLSA